MDVVVAVVADVELAAATEGHAICMGERPAANLAQSSAGVDVDLMHDACILLTDKYHRPPPQQKERLGDGAAPGVPASAEHAVGVVRDKHVATGCHGLH
jgi:hypothetical protein